MGWSDKLLEIRVKQVDTGGDQDDDNSISYYRLKRCGETFDHIMHVSLLPYVLHVSMYNYVEYVDIYSYKVQTQ